jgi:hypothetical protein
VHLPTSLAIRAGLPVLAIELYDDRGNDQVGVHIPGPDDVAGVTRFDLDIGELDREADRLISAVEHRLGEGARIVPAIELAPTTVPAFIGLTEANIYPQKVSSWREFENHYGGFTYGSMLPYSVYGWFANGGRECYVVPIEPLRQLGVACRPTTADYIGTEQPPTGLRGVAALADVTVLVLPDVIAVASSEDGTLDLAAWKVVQLEAIQLAEVRDIMALLDAPPGLSSEQVKEWRVDEAAYASSYACLYYPWIRLDDPYTGGVIEVPPSGHLAGLWATTDRDRGVWGAPANRRLEWVGDVAHQTTSFERSVLTVDGINPIRSLGSGDVRPWGTRTLSSDPARSDLGPTRLLQATERACAAGLAWMQFERNDATTRSMARRSVEIFLARLWRAGGLVGDEQEEAFVVRCDEATSPPGSPVRVEVGVACTEPGAFAWLAFGRRASSPGTSVG